MEKSFELIVLLFAALATGGLMVNWIGLGRAMSRLSESTYVEFHQATNHTFNPYMPIVVVGSILGGIVLALLSPGIHSLSGQLAIAGSVCYVAVLAIALRTDVRINKQIADWSVQSPPADWASIRASWIRFHIVRTLFHFRDWPATFSLAFSVDVTTSLRENQHELLGVYLGTQ